MTSELYVDSQGDAYLVDWDLVTTIVRSHTRAKAQLAHSREEVEKHWIGPDLYNLEVDWSAVRSATESQSEDLLRQMYKDLEDGGVAFVEGQISEFVRLAAENKAEFRSRIAQAQEKSMVNVEQSVRRGKMGEDVAKFVRDGSAATLVIGASILSGGAAAGVAATLGRKAAWSAVSAGVDTLITLQDAPDGRKGQAAAYTFATKFALNMFPVGKAGDKLFMFILKTEAEMAAATGQALVEGKQLEEALIKGVAQGGSSLVGAAGGKALSSQQGRRLMKKIAYPMAVKMDYSGAGRTVISQTENAKRGIKFARDMAAKHAPSIPQKAASMTIEALLKDGVQQRQLRNAAVLVDGGLAGRAVKYLGEAMCEAG